LISTRVMHRWMTAAATSCTAAGATKEEREEQHINASGQYRQYRQYLAEALGADKESHFPQRGVPLLADVLVARLPQHLDELRVKLVLRVPGSSSQSCAMLLSVVHCRTV
jgi:hypothetical protein